MEYRNLRVERDGPVATVTLDRPEKLNALSWALQGEIEAAARSFADDETTRVVIFTGAGRHFSAGADLTDSERPVPQTRLGVLRQSRLGPRMIRSIVEIEPITIAAINGVAAGGAACIATACDFRIGADDCRVGYPEVPLGMNLSWTALPLCVHLIGPARAKRMVMLGQQETAQTLLDWGFLDEVAPADGLMAAARALAARYAALPPLAAQLVKRSVNAISNALDQSVMHADMEQLMLTHQTDDFREGVRAWFEKREGSFSGD
jgi:enoyl-CoA hydratase/carnithine racemase